jgi:hypothetical protein
MKTKQSSEPQKYIVDDYTFTVSIVVSNFNGAMAASHWCGRMYPNYQCQFITEERYQQLKKDLNK